MKSPHDLYREIVAETNDVIAGIRAVRSQFGMSLSEAKEVMLQADGIASSLSEHQKNLAPDLEKAFLELEQSGDLLFSKQFNELDVVRVVALNGDRKFNGTEGVMRSPRIGDIGTVVHVLRAEGHFDAFTVEAVASSGHTLWVADFTANELQPV